MDPDNNPFVTREMAAKEQRRILDIVVKKEVARLLREEGKACDEADVAALYEKGYVKLFDHAAVRP